MSQSGGDYLGVIYDRTRTPETDYPRALADHLCRRFGLSDGGRLLEIGCGRGDFLRAFRAAGMNGEGVDREQSAASLSPDLAPFIRRCDVTSEPLPFDDAAFDVVYHKSLLEHMWDPMPLMRETWRVLKPGGALLVLTPDWRTQYRTFYEDFTHCRPYDVTALTDLLAICGYERCVCEDFRQLPGVWNSAALRWLSAAVGSCLSVHLARRMTAATGVKFFRWSAELMVLGYGVKPADGP